MKHLIKFFLFTIVPILLNGCATTAPRHVEREGGFSYEVPAGWTVRPFRDLQYKIIATTPVNNFSPNMTAIGENYNGNLESYVKANIPVMQKGIPGFRILKQGKEKTMAGKVFHYMQYLHEAAEVGTLKQTAYFFDLGGGRKLVLTCTPAIGTEKRIDADCLQVARSLRIK